MVFPLENREISSRGSSEPLYVLLSCKLSCLLVVGFSRTCCGVLPTTVVGFSPHLFLGLLTFIIKPRIVFWVLIYPSVLRVSIQETFLSLVIPSSFLTRSYCNGVYPSTFPFASVERATRYRNNQTAVPIFS